MKFKIKKIHYKLGLKGEIKNNETSIKESRKKKIRNHKNKDQSKTSKHNKKIEQAKFFNVFFLHIKSPRCKLKSLCTDLIKQINNHCVKK
jgi:hypothetical protein